MSQQARVIPLEHLRMRDVDQVGGKNASLGEMIGHAAPEEALGPGEDDDVHPRTMPS